MFFKKKKPYAENIVLGPSPSQEARPCPVEPLQLVEADVEQRTAPPLMSLKDKLKRAEAWQRLSAFAASMYEMLPDKTPEAREKFTALGLAYLQNMVDMERV